MTHWSRTGGVLGLILIPLLAFTQRLPDEAWYGPLLNAPQLTNVSANQPLVIAIIDDGFDLAHPDLQPFWHRSAREIAGNRLDDDGNGYIDDHLGWDVADQDGDVAFPPGRVQTFYHGTYVTGVLTSVLQRIYGEQASELFRILPVKALGDGAVQTHLRAGYQGVAYALEQNVDLIVCAWSGGNLSAEQKQLFQRARAANIPVLAAAGNTYTKTVLSPAAHPDVIAVSAVGRNLSKLPEANYGLGVDLCGPGEDVYGPDTRTGGQWDTDRGTSPAVAIMAAVMATLRQVAPEASVRDLLTALKNTAQPLEAFNTRYAGKLGAGFPQVAPAVAWLQAAETCCQFQQPGLTQGTLSPQTMPAKTDRYEWPLAPAGDYSGIHLKVERAEGSAREGLAIFDGNGNPVGELALTTPGQELFVPGNQAVVRYTQNRSRPPSWFEVDFWVETIDSSTLYCQDTRYWETAEGTFTDGSGDAPYANQSACRWQITVPAGKRVEIWFDAFDTEAQTDFVYLFEGRSSIPANMLAKFSGPDLPPVVQSRTHEVLVWFVTDDQRTGQGWTLHYKTIEE